MLSPYFKVEVTIFARLLSNLYVSQIFLFNYAIWLWILLRVKWSYLDKKGILNLSSTCFLSWLLTWASFFQMSLTPRLQVKVKVKSLSRVRLCDPMDCSLSCSSIHGIFQARVLKWIAISFSRGPSWPRNRTRVSHIAGRYFTIWATREAVQKFMWNNCGKYKFRISFIFQQRPWFVWGDETAADLKPSTCFSNGSGTPRKNIHFSLFFGKSAFTFHAWEVLTCLHINLFQAPHCWSTWA